MGILGYAFGMKKIDRIRLLIEDRVTNDPFAQDSGFTIYDVRNLTDMQIMGSAEATVVTISESICDLIINKGLSDIEAINIVDKHRQKTSFSEMPRPNEIFLYIKHRLSTELNAHGQLPDENIKKCMLASEHMLFYPSEQTDAKHALKYAELQILKTKYRNLMEALCNYYDGETDDMELYDNISMLLEPWLEEKQRAKKRRDTMALKMAIAKLDKNNQ